MVIIKKKESRNNLELSEYVDGKEKYIELSKQNSGERGSKNDGLIDNKYLNNKMYHEQRIYNNKIKKIKKKGYDKYDYNILHNLSHGK